MDNATLIRSAIDAGGLGPFTWRRGKLTATLARDPGVALGPGYGGRFLWAVRWPMHQCYETPGGTHCNLFPYRPAQERHGVAGSLILAERAIEGAIEEGRPPYAPPAFSS